MNKLIYAPVRPGLSFARREFGSFLHMLILSRFNLQAEPESDQ